VPLARIERRAGSTAAAAPRWPRFTALGVAALVFGVWWLFLALVHGLGTCGEDSDLDAVEYVRLCGSPEDGGGLVWQRLTAIGIAAMVVTLGAVALVWLRRAGWPLVSAAVVGLFGFAVLAVYVGA